MLRIATIADAKAISVFIVIACATVSHSFGSPGGNTVTIYTTGEDLTQDCRTLLRIRQTGTSAMTTQEAYDYASCYAYVVAIVEGDIIYEHARQAQGLPPLAWTPAIPDFCIPFNSNASTLAEVVARYLDEHPEERSIAAYHLVRKALADAHPCELNFEHRPPRTPAASRP